MAYAEARKLSPTGLTAAIAINAGVLAALFTASPEIIKKLPNRLTLYPVSEPIEPDPLPPEPRTEPRDRVAENPQPTPPLVDPVVDAKVDGPVVTLTDGPVIDLTPTRDPGPTVIETPPAPPPLIGARRDPRHEANFQPDYPSSKLRLEEEGRVTVRVLVGADGRVKAVEPIGSPDPAFLAATRKQALSRWRFKPATRGGTPEEQWITQSVTFTITR
jgi:periplasmic protein TonB